MTHATRPPFRRAALAALKLAGLILLLIAANHAVGQFPGWLEFDIRPGNEYLVHRAIILAAVVYALALALPFVPGVEIGLALIAMLGIKVVPLVYLCTVSGLLLAYMAGRFIRPRVLAALARDLGLRRVAVLLVRFERLPASEAVSAVLADSPNRAATFLIRHRYAALALAINLPGNFVLGGGGGIALLAGMSRLFSTPLYVLTVLVAVSPVPLLVLFLGPAILAH